MKIARCIACNRYWMDGLVERYFFRVGHTPVAGLVNQQRVHKVEYATRHSMNSLIWEIAVCADFSPLQGFCLFW